MKIKDKIKLIIEEPQILLGKIKGFHSLYCYNFLTAQSLSKKKFQTIIDIGANRGEYSEVCRYFCPDAQIYAFEANPDLFYQLSNIKNISPKLTGLWNVNTNLIFYANQTENGRSSFLEYGKDSKEFRNDKLIKRKVNVTRFDSFDIQIDRPCFVKIDVEGAEIKVLEGFGDRLKEVDVLQLEYSFQDNFKGQTTFKEIISLLEKYNFELCPIQKLVFDRNNMPCQCDLFFFKK